MSASAIAFLISVFVVFAVVLTIFIYWIPRVIVERRYKKAGGAIDDMLRNEGWTEEDLPMKRDQLKERDTGHLGMKFYFLFLLLIPAALILWKEFFQGP